MSRRSASCSWRYAASSTSCSANTPIRWDRPSSVSSARTALSGGGVAIVGAIVLPERFLDHLVALRRRVRRRAGVRLARRRRRRRAKTILQVDGGCCSGACRRETGNAASLGLRCGTAEKAQPVLRPGQRFRRRLSAQQEALAKCRPARPRRGSEGGMAIGRYDMEQKTGAGHYRTAIEDGSGLGFLCGGGGRDQMVRGLRRPSGFPPAGSTRSPSPPCRRRRGASRPGRRS